MNSETAIKSIHLLLAIIFGPLTAQSMAGSYTWTGASGTAWSATGNWTQSTAPGTSDTANIVSSSTNQNVYYDTSASGALNTFYLTQTSAAANQLILQRNLTISNGVTLGASNGGSSIIYLDGMDLSGTGGSSGTVLLTVSSTAGIVLNGGGVLAMSNGGTNNSYAAQVTSNVSLNGGALILYAAKISGQANQGTISGNFAMSSGTLVLGSTDKGGTNSDSRLTITGTCLISNGVVSGTVGTLILNGTTNSIAGLVSAASNIKNITFSGGSVQNFVSDSTTTNAYIQSIGLRAGAALLTRTIGATSGTLSFGTLYHGNTTGSGTTLLKLSSDVALTSATPMVAQYGGGNGTTITDIVDLAGHNLYATNSQGALTFNNVNASQYVKWALVNSMATTGTIVANGFNFSGASQTDVGLNSLGKMVLVATGTNYTNDLGTTGTIAANSIFAYIGNGAANLSSSRSLGSLMVGNGSTSSTLSLSTTQETLQGNLTVNQNAALNLLDKTVTETGSAPGVGGLNGGGSIYNNGGSASNQSTAVLNLNTANGDGYFTGVIADHSWGYGYVSMRLSGGAGRQILAGTNTYTGATVISAGNTLQLGDGASDGVISNSSAISNSGALEYFTSGAQNYGGTISGSGSVSMKGTGTQILSGSNTYTGATVVAGGELDINGSIAATSAVTVKTGATLGGSGTANGTVGVQGGQINGAGLKLGATTFDGQSTISGTTTAASITVNTGTTTASGVTTSNGNLSIVAGATLKNTGSFAAAIVNVANTAMLTNNGTLSGTVNVNGLLNGGGAIQGALTVKTSGELAGGNTPVITTVAGNLTVETGAKVSMQIAGSTGAGADYDQITVTGASSLVTLNAGSILNLTIADGMFTEGALTLIENRSDHTITGTFSSVVIGGSTYDLSATNKFTYGGKEYELLYNVDADGDSKANDLQLAVVPEPGTWAMLSGGLGVLLGAQRVRRRASHI